MSKEQVKKNEPAKDEKVKDTKESPPIIEIPSAQRSSKSVLIKAKSARAQAVRANRDLDLQTTQEVVCLINNASTSGEFTIRVHYLPRALQQKLEAKGYKIARDHEHVTITWE